MPALARLLARALPLTAAAALLATRAAPAGAQDVGASSGTGGHLVRVGLAGGVIVPRQGATARDLRAGTQAQGFVTVQLPAGLPALRFNVDYGRMRIARTPATQLPAGAESDEVTRTLLAGIGSLKLDLLHGPVRPYVLAGVGAFHLKDAATLADGVGHSQMDLGLDGGAGIALRLGRLDAFVETRLQNVYTKQQGFVDTKSIAAFPVTFGFVF